MPLATRAVLVTRETEYEALIARHATREQAKFFLQSRDQDIDHVQERHERLHAALHRVRTAIPSDWRVATVTRDDLDRFLFASEDVVVAVGQDGLVANLAKYLDGQPVVGINPEPGINPGVLVPHPPDAIADLLLPVSSGRAEIQHRTMAEARLDDGQVLSSLNEIFIGHSSHQSARYTLAHGGRDEDQSSSGVIVATGTGATGWARSIMDSRRITLDLDPTQPTLGYFVREPWPSPSTGTSLSFGQLSVSEPLQIRSRMQSGGVIFADGIERDYIGFDWGREVTIGIAERKLNLVAG